MSNHCCPEERVLGKSRTGVKGNGASKDKEKEER